MTNEQTTGDDGKATFQLEYGDYVATITKDGYQTVTENIAFRSNHKNFNITLQEDTPTGTGTVTVTCQKVVDDETILMEDVFVMLYNGRIPPVVDDSTVVGFGKSNTHGVAVIYTYDTTTHAQTQVTDIPFGTYNVYAHDSVHLYMGSVTVDGNEEMTITLTRKYELGDYNYVIPLGADTITGTLNIGEQDQYGGYLVDIITSSNPHFVTTDGMNIGDTIVADGFTKLVLSDYEGEIADIILLGRENASIQTVFDDNPRNDVSVLMATEQFLSDVVDWSKVVGLGNTGGEYGATLMYEIDSATHEQTETVATITNGTYYVYATSDDFDGEATVAVTDTNRSFTITLT